MLQRQGERATRLWYVRSGLVMASSVARSGRELSCAVRGRDHMVGLESALGRPTQSSVVAITEVTLCSIEVTSFRAWLGLLDSPLGSMFDLALGELGKSSLDVQRLAGSAAQRVARFLLQRFEAGSGPEPLTLPKAVLSRMLGMRPETLSRALSDLRKCGVLAPGRRVVVAAPHALRALVDD